MPDTEPLDDVEPDRSQLQQIIRGLTEGIILVEPDCRITWANEAALTIHGVSEPGELGAKVADYQARFRLTYRNGRVLAPDDYPLARLCRGETFEDVIVEVSQEGRPEPDWIHSERGLVLTDASGDPDCLVLVITDATEAYEAEERFESLFNANPAPALIARLADLRFVRVNEGFLELSD